MTSAEKFKTAELIRNLDEALEGIRLRDSLLEDWCDSWNDLKMKEKRPEWQEELFTKTNDLWERESELLKMNPWKEMRLMNIRLDAISLERDALLVREEMHSANYNCTPRY